jgi:hypothetical protein
MSCGKQMKLNVSHSIEFHLLFFFYFADQICFCLPFLKYGLLLAIGSPLIRALPHAIITPLPGVEHQCVPHELYLRQPTCPEHLKLRPIDETKTIVGYH